MIIEKKLGIPPDYQYNAINKGVWLQRNWHRNKFDVIQKQIVHSKHKTSLDLGTGSGNFEILFARKFKRIIGVDHNSDALSFLASRLKILKIKNIKLIKADIKKLPINVTSRKYDLIVIIDAIEHLRYKDAVKTISSLKKMLIKKGKIIIITPNYRSPWIILESIMDIFNIVPKFAGEQHLAKFDTKSLETILKKSGYINIESSSFNLFSFTIPFQNIRKILLNFETKYLGSRGCLICVTAFHQ